MNHLFKYIFTWLSILSFYGQNPQFEVIDKRKGLTSNTVYDVFQDSKGFMWFGTVYGLVRYDGYEVKSYLNLKKVSPEATCIREDLYGRIWYENFDNYLFFIQNDSVHALNQNKTLNHVRDFSLIADHMCVIQEKGIDIFSLNSLKRIKTIFIDFKIDSLGIFWCRQSKNNYYILADKVYEINNINKLCEISYIIFENKYKPNFLLNFKNDIVPISLNNEIVIIYKLENKVYVPDIHLKIKTRIQSATFVDEKFWLCSPKGVYVYNENWQPAFINNYLFIDKNISSVFKDREGGFWISTLNEGLLHVKDFATKKYYDGVNLNKLSLIGDNLFMTTKKGEILKLNLHSYEGKAVYKDKYQSEITSLFVDSAKNTLYCNPKTLHILNLSQNKKKEMPVIIKDLVKVNDKYFAYAATGGCGLISITNKTYNIWDSIYIKNLTHFSFSFFFKKLNGKSVTYFKKNNSIYYGTNLGLFKVLPNKIEEIKYKNSSLYILRIYSFFNTIYALTNEGIVYEINEKNEFTSIFKKYKLNDRNIINIKLVQHFLFLNSHNKLYYINLKTKEMQEINVNDLDINDIELHMDQLILSTDDGLIFQPFKSNIRNNSPPLFVINTIKINDSIQNLLKSPILNYFQNKIEINYSILSFKTNGQFPLYYKINDGKWQQAIPTSRTLKLEALAPGNYTIIFKLGNNLKQTTSDQTVKFKIKKPWWLTWYSIIIYCFTFVLVFISFYLWKTNFLKKKNQLLKEKIILERQLNKSTLKSIKAQMNPHFFYNALNTIQSFVYSDDKRNASLYLSKFSKLTRLILEMSEKETVPLSDEINALKLYLDIEQVRFNEDMSYEINLSNDLNLELIKIPSMLIQPYVENAVKHGLLHKHGKKKLSIIFQKKDNNLHIEIEDNGVGRKKAEELNIVKKNKPEPFSSTANLKRIELLNANNKNLGFQIIDNVNENGSAVGTTVIIIIPIENS